MTKTLSLLLSCYLMLSLLSCSHPRVEEFEASIGLIGQDDMIRRFGYPKRLKRLPTEIEAWDYEFLSENSRCVGYRVYFDKDRRSTHWEPRSCHRGEQSNRP